MKTVQGLNPPPGQSVFQGDHSHCMWLGQPSSPQSQSQTEQPYNRADKGTYLCSQDAEGLTKTNPGPLCGWWEGEGIYGVLVSAPQPFTCQWPNQSASDPGRAGAPGVARPSVLCFSLLPSPWDLALNLLAAGRYLANLVMRALSPSSSPEPG